MVADISVVHMSRQSYKVQTHTIHRSAAEDLEKLGHATGLPIKNPRYFKRVAWAPSSGFVCIAGIKGAQRHSANLIIGGFLLLEFGVIFAMEVC